MAAATGCTAASAMQGNGSNAENGAVPPARRTTASPPESCHGGIAQQGRLDVATTRKPCDAALLPRFADLGQGHLAQLVRCRREVLERVSGRDVQISGCAAAGTATKPAPRRSRAGACPRCGRRAGKGTEEGLTARRFTAPQSTPTAAGREAPLCPVRFPYRARVMSGRHPPPAAGPARRCRSRRCRKGHLPGS